MGAAIGSMKCRGLDCSRDVPVTQTAGGSLSMRCGFCGFSAYAQPGTKAARAIRAAMTEEEGGAAPSSSSPSEPPVPAPAPAPNSVFSLGGLK